MCIAPIIRHYLIFLVFLIYVFFIFGSDYFDQLFANSENIGFIVIIIIGVLDFFNKCPRCRKIVTRTKNGIYTPFIGLKCDKCGHDLLKCKVEEDNKSK